MQNTVLFIINIIWTLSLFFYIYKIGYYFYSAQATNDNRAFKGFTIEFAESSISQKMGILPIPYFSEKKMNQNAAIFLKKRTRYVFYFYFSFVGYLAFPFLFPMS